MSLSLPWARYQKPELIAGFYQQLTERVLALPGVRSTGASSDLPWTGYDENNSFTIEGKNFPPDQSPSARYHFATPNYFRTIGTPLIAGRDFNSGDTNKAPRVILINQSMARQYWPGEDAVGKRISFSDQPKEEDWLTIAGVIGDVKDYPSSAEAVPAFYWSHSQQPAREMFMAIRTDFDPLSLVESIRGEVRALDKDLAVADVRALETIGVAAVAGQRFTLLLVGLFALTALILATIGIYGVMSYLVAQRTHEIGIRLALGAQARDVLKIVVKQGMSLAVIGAGMGLIAAAALTRLMASLLFGVNPTDPLTFIAISALLVAVALLACYLPARRATKVDPLVALRYE
jgi:predicted permease